MDERPQPSSLIPIQPHGSRPLLFCVPPLASSGRGFKALSRYLGADQPLYALEPLGLDDAQQPHASVEEIDGNNLEDTDLMRGSFQTRRALIKFIETKYSELHS